MLDFSPDFSRFETPCVPHEAVGVGHDEKPVSPVRESQRFCGYNRPDCIKPESVKIPEYSPKDTPAVIVPELGDILDDDVPRPGNGNGVAEGWPEPSVVLCSPLGSCDGEGLAGESAVDDVVVLRVKRVPSRECINVIVLRYLRPVPRQDSAV